MIGLKQPTNLSSKIGTEVYNEMKSNITEIDNRLSKGCELSQEVKDNYEDWQKNAINKELALKLKISLDKWKKKYGNH